MRHQNKVIRARGGEPRDRTPTASPSPVVTATVSGSRSDAARTARSREEKGEENQNGDAFESDARLPETGARDNP